MKKRIRVGDRVVIAEGHYWPHSKYGTCIRKDPITSGKVIKAYWFVIKQDDAPEPMLFTRSQVEKYTEAQNGVQEKV